MKLEEVLKKLEKLIEEHKTKVIPQLVKYRTIAENHTGLLYKDKIIKSLRLQEEIKNILSEKGIIHVGDQETGLKIEDIIVEYLLPSATLDTLKMYSVGTKPMANLEDKDWLKEFERTEGIHQKIKELVQEMLVTGDSFYKIEKIENKAQITILYKENVIIVPDSFNNTRTGAYVYFATKKDSNNKEYTYAEVYLKNGEVYLLDNSQGKYKRIDQKRKKEDVNAELGEFNIKHIPGLKKVADTLYSHSIFKGSITNLLEVTIRDTSNSYVFNKITNPRMVSSEDFEEIDTTTGEKIIRSGGMLKADNPEGANSTRYIEPPTSQINSSFSHREMIVKNLYAQFGVNEISLGLSNTGGISSGEAFKKAITATLNKCKDILSCLDTPLINLYKLSYKLEKNKDIDVTIEYFDGISLTEKEKTDNNIALVNSKILSRKTILKKQGFTDEQVEEELKRIVAEEETLNPPMDIVDIE